MDYSQYRDHTRPIQGQGCRASYVKTHLPRVISFSHFTFSLSMGPPVWNAEAFRRYLMYVKRRPYVG